MRVEIPKGRTPPDWVYRYDVSHALPLGINVLVGYQRRAL